MTSNQCLQGSQDVILLSDTVIVLDGSELLGEKGHWIELGALQENSFQSSPCIYFNHKRSFRVGVVIPS